MHSYIRNCVFEHRIGDPPIFVSLKSGGLAVRLNGYTICPNEKMPSLNK